MFLDEVSGAVSVDKAALAAKAKDTALAWAEYLEAEPRCEPDISIATTIRAQAQEISRLSTALNKAQVQQSWFRSKFLQAFEIMECNDPLNAQLIKQTPAWGPRKQENYMKNEKMPTPESQAAYDLAYEAGLKGEDQPPLIQTDTPTKEDAMANLATVMGYGKGLNEHYKRKGIRTAFMND